MITFLTHCPAPDLPSGLFAPRARDRDLLPAAPVTGIRIEALVRAGRLDEPADSATRRRNWRGRIGRGGHEPRATTGSSRIEASVPPC